MTKNNEKDIQRKCIGCFETKPRAGMIRILKEHKTGKIILQPDSKTFGRSCYVCKNPKCLENALKKGKISKFIRGVLPEDLKENLKNLSD